MISHRSNVYRRCFMSVCGSPSAALRWVFFFNDTATTEIYTLSLHDALPIYDRIETFHLVRSLHKPFDLQLVERDRKSTRLNSSHLGNSYAVFCLKNKKKDRITIIALITHIHITHPDPLRPKR